jgi:hypothetical protein
LFNRDGGFISALDKQVSDFDLDAEDAGSEQRIWYTQTEAAVIGYRLVGGGGPTEYGLPICSPTHVVSTLPLGAFVSTDCHLDSASLPLDGGQLLFFARSFSDPMVYAEDLSPTVAIAASPTHVYWATKTGVHRVSRALQPDGGPAAVQAVATGAVDVCGLALDDRSIYWTDKATGRVRQRALDLSTGATDIASSEAGPCAIGVNSTSVLWLDTLDRTIRSRPK